MNARLSSAVAHALEPPHDVDRARRRPSREVLETRSSRDGPRDDAARLRASPSVPRLNVEPEHA